MTLETWTIAEVPEEWRDRFEKLVWADCVRDGRAARAAGLPESHPLGKMNDPDMTASWAMGWHQEDRDIKEKLRR